jgi:hypothetical protein
MLVIGRLQAATRAKRAHLEGHEVDRLLRGELGRAESRRVVRHLLAGCPVCQATARPLWALGDRPLIPLPSLRPRGAH